MSIKERKKWAMMLIKKNNLCVELTFDENKNPKWFEMIIVQQIESKWILINPSD